MRSLLMMLLWPSVVGLVSGSVSAQVVGQPTMTARHFVGPPAPTLLQPKQLLTGMGTVGAIPRWTGVHALSDSAIVQPNVPGSIGNIGIGSTMPKADLDVRGNASRQLSGTVTTTGGLDVLGDGAALFQDELEIGDAISIGGNVRTVVAISMQSLLSVDATLPAMTGVLAYADSDLLRVQNAAGVDQIVVKANGTLKVQGLVGVTDGSEGKPGEVGEVVEFVGNFSFPSDPPTGAITLSPGDWDLTAMVSFGGYKVSSGLGQQWFVTIGISPGGVLGDGRLNCPVASSSETGGGTVRMRANITATTVYKVDVDSPKNGSGSGAYSIRARRMR